MSKSDKNIVEISKNKKAKALKKLLKSRECSQADKDLSLVYAAAGGDIDKVRFWLKVNANVNSSDDAALRCAALAGKPKIVGHLLKKGANAGAGFNIALKDSFEQAKLHPKRTKKYMKVADLLIKHGASVEALNCTQRLELYSHVMQK